MTVTKHELDRSAAIAAARAKMIDSMADSDLTTAEWAKVICGVMSLIVSALAKECKELDNG